MNAIDLNLLNTTRIIPRDIEPKLREVAKEFPVVVVTGPRQSGKTTLVKHVFKDYNYVNLEEFTNFELANTDPAKFLETYKPPLIIDEVQRAPVLLHELQAVVDKNKHHPKFKGQYILTGSNNLLLYEKVTQSLAGRAYILTLLPFTVSEVFSAIEDNGGSINLSDLLTKGFFPPVYAAGVSAENFYNSYVDTYVQKDVRNILKIHKVLDFIRFIKLVGYRSATVLDYSELSKGLGVSVNTVKEWLSTLYATYLVYLLQPLSKNYGKRIIRSPKLYVVDTGVVAHLTGVAKLPNLEAHPLFANLFENFVVLELAKQFRNLGLDPSLHMYYFRDKSGHEVDLVIEYGDRIVPIEIKSSMTFHKSFVENLQYFNQISNTKGGYLVYAGKSLKFADYTVLNWREIKDFIKKRVVQI